MRTLILLRHAKSSWDQPGLADIDRPLNRRGKESAPVTARWLEAQGLVPDLVLCSPSKRTRQTIRRMCKAVPAIPEPRIVERLYEAAPEDILAALRAAPAGAGRVMVVGHEPGMSMTAARLADGRAPVPLRAAFSHFPTAAAAVFEADAADWQGVGWGGMRLTAFARPRELMAAGA